MYARAWSAAHEPGVCAPNGMHQSSELVPLPAENAPPACGRPKRYSERSFIARQHTTISAAPDATAALAWWMVATEAAPPPGIRVVKARSRMPRQRISPISSLGSSENVISPSISAGGDASVVARGLHGLGRELELA